MLCWVQLWLWQRNCSSVCLCVFSESDGRCSKSKCLGWKGSLTILLGFVSSQVLYKTTVTLHVCDATFTQLASAGVSVGGKFNHFTFRCPGGGIFPVFTSKLVFYTTPFSLSLHKLYGIQRITFQKRREPCMYSKWFKNRFELVGEVAGPNKSLPVLLNSIDSYPQGTR